MAVEKGAKLDGRKGPTQALKGTELWKLADMLWRFHQTGDHEAHEELMAVHTVIVEAAEEADRAHAARKKAKR